MNGFSTCVSFLFCPLSMPSLSFFLSPSHPFSPPFFHLSLLTIPILFPGPDFTDTHHHRGFISHPEQCRRGLFPRPHFRAGGESRRGHGCVEGVDPRKIR